MNATRKYAETRHPEWRIISLPMLACGLFTVFSALVAGAKDIYVNIDFYDEMLRCWRIERRGTEARDVTNLVKRCRDAGATGVNWRVASLGVACHPAINIGDIEYALSKAQFSPDVERRHWGGKTNALRVADGMRDVYRATMRSMPDSLDVAVKTCHALGVKINFWIDIHDELFGKFVTEHPECLVRTPQGTTMPGVRDYGNETAVRSKLAELEELFRYRPDGFYFCPSCHSRHLAYDEPDEAFGRLEAAKFTDFLRRAKASFRPYGFTLTMGVGSGGTLDFCSPHFSPHAKYRIEHDWRTWVDEGIVDALVLADYERFNRGCDNFWRAKGVVPDGVNDPAERFLPEFTGHVKGRVPLYYYVNLPGSSCRPGLSEVMRADSATIALYGLDGAFLHEAANLESHVSGFRPVEEMRRLFDMVDKKEMAR